MSSIDIYNFALVSVLLADAATLFYASYWALIIRRAWVVKLYRNQALGVFLIAFSQGLVAIGFAGTEGAISRSPVDLLVLGLNLIAVLFIFYWIDAFLLTARRSDPLLRDTFHWRHLRFLLWAVPVTLPVATPALNSPVPFTGLVTLGTGAVTLPAAGRRSKDPTMRRHLRWFGLYAAFFVVFFALLGASASAANGSTISFAFLGLEGAMLWASSYSLYHSATSLAPLCLLPGKTPV